MRRSAEYSAGRPIGRLHRSLVLLLVGMALTSAAVWADDQWSVYVNNHRLSFVTRGKLDTLQVDVEAFARAVGMICEKDDATGLVKLNGKAMGQAKRGADQTLVPLQDAVSATGCTMEVHADLQMIDIHTESAKRTREDIEKEMLHARTVQTHSQMTYLYGMVRDAFNDRLHLEIRRPIVTHWVTRQEIQQKAGGDAYGYAYATTRGNEVGTIELYVPFGLSPSKTLHSLAHEMGHCWQFDHGIFHADSLRLEGFCEWVAYKVLESLTLPGEISDMRSNLYSEYREGFAYFQKIERESGTVGVIAEMLRAGGK